MDRTQSGCWRSSGRRSLKKQGHACVLQDKLEPSEALGDLLRRAGDNDAALAIFQRANIPGKVIEGLAAKGDFDALSKYRCGRGPARCRAACCWLPSWPQHPGWQVLGLMHVGFAQSKAWPLVFHVINTGHTSGLLLLFVHM